MKKILFIAFTLFTSICSGQASKYSQPIDKAIQGNWKGDKNCEISAGVFTIGANNPIEIEVNSNQVYISATIVKKEGGGYLVYFNKTEDLGRGGMNLKWEDYSKDTPIAELVLNGNNLKVVWKGFYNNKSKQYEWLKDTDWNAFEDFDGYFYRCN